MEGRPEFVGMRRFAFSQLHGYVDRHIVNATSYRYGKRDPDAESCSVQPVDVGEIPVQFCHDTRDDGQPQAATVLIVIRPSEEAIVEPGQIVVRNTRTVLCGGQSG